MIIPEEFESPKDRASKKLAVPGKKEPARIAMDERVTEKVITDLT